MRLFIAIELSEPIRRSILELSRELSQFAPGCKVTREENMHVTLAFLGELPGNRLPAARRCMERVRSGPFDLELDQIGSFRRREGGDIWWLGVRRSTELTALERSLRWELESAGFALEERDFRPHITLLREAAMPAGFDKSQIEFPRLSQQVEQITLFESLRERGVLTYRPKARAELRGAKNL